MIEANEYYVVGRLQEIGLSKKQIRRFIASFAGWRIYFRKKKSEYEEIKEMYNQMLKAGNTRKQAIKALSEIFEKSEKRIREITAYQGSLFE